MALSKRKFLKWTEGRQNTSYAVPYLVMYLLPVWFCKLIKHDLVLIKYRERTRIPRHVDNCMWWKGYDTYRMNITLREAAEGGAFQTWSHSENKDAGLAYGTILGFPFVTFRPDIMPHSVTTITKGTRLILSFGKFVKNKEREPLSEDAMMLCTREDIATVYREMLRYKANITGKRGTNCLMMPCTNMWRVVKDDTDLIQIMADMIYILNEPEYTHDMCLQQVLISVPAEFRSKHV